MTRVHGTRARFARGCRCLPCCDANRDYQAAWRARQSPPPADDPRHGRISTYINHHCRCESCRNAMRARYVGAS